MAARGRLVDTPGCLGADRARRLALAPDLAAAGPHPIHHPRKLALGCGCGPARPAPPRPRRSGLQDHGGGALRAAAPDCDGEAGSVRLCRAGGRGMAGLARRERSKGIPLAGARQIAARCPLCPAGAGERSGIARSASGADRRQPMPGSPRPSVGGPRRPSPGVARGGGGDCGSLASPGCVLGSHLGASVARHRVPAPGSPPVFDFHWPWLALLLPLPLLLPYLWPRRGEEVEETLEGQRQTLLHPRLDELQLAYKVRRPGLQIGGWVHRTLLALALDRPGGGPDAARMAHPLHRGQHPGL